MTTLNSLGSDLQTYILTFLEDQKDFFSLRFASKNWCEVIENQAEYCYKFLKENSELIRFVTLVENDHSNASYFAKVHTVAKLIKRSYPQIEINLFNNPQEAISDISQQIKTLNDEALVTILPTIAKAANLSDKNLPQTGDECRTWLNNNQAEVSKIEELDLSYLDLKVLPPEIEKLSSLTELDLSRNQITAIPKEIGNYLSLKCLRLSDNQITAIPKEIEKLSSLTELGLSYNQITAIPKEIEKLSSLTELDLSYNQITAIPKEIGKCTSLQYLSLSENQITAIPKEIGNLRSLERLYLSYNQITAIPTEIGKLSSLKYLYFEHNQITAIPKEIEKLLSLIRLDLSDNQITAIPTEIEKIPVFNNLTRAIFRQHKALNAFWAMSCN